MNKSDKESGHKMKNMALKRTLTPKNTEGTLCSHKKAQNKITIAAAQKEKANININKTEKNRYKADEVAQLFRKKK